MSNRLFQGIIHQMKDTVDRVIGVIDDKGNVISCSELTKIGDVFEGCNLQNASPLAPTKRATTPSSWPASTTSPPAMRDF